MVFSLEEWVEVWERDVLEEEGRGELNAERPAKIAGEFSEVY